MFCCLRRCYGLNLNSNINNGNRESDIRLDTTFMGYEVVIIKDGERVCGSGGALANAPLVQSKSYFEVKIQQGGKWSIGLATRETNLNLTQGGMDEYSWALCQDGSIRHNKEVLFDLDKKPNSFTEISLDHNNASQHSIPQEGDTVGVSYDHVQMKFYLNGKELETDNSVNNLKGTLYPALYVDDGSILDIIFDNFQYTVPNGFDKIMLEQSLL